MKVLLFVFFSIVFAQSGQEPDITEETKQKIAQEENALSPDAKTFVNRVKEAFLKNQSENATFDKQQVEAEVDKIRGELEGNPTLKAEIEKFDKDVSATLEADPNIGDTLKNAREMAEANLHTNRLKREDNGNGGQGQHGFGFHKPTEEQMNAINQEIAQLQQKNPEAGKLATEAQSIIKNETMTPKEKMGKLHELRSSQTDQSVLAALQEFEQKAKNIMHSGGNQ